MSGPIVRRYGFPNFEKIFGERPVEHGVEDASPAEAGKDTSSAAEAKPPAEAVKKSEGTARPGTS